MEKATITIESMRDLQCPICDKKMYYYRDRTDNYKCRKCGGEFYVEEHEDSITVMEQ